MAEHPPASVGSDDAGPIPFRHVYTQVAWRPHKRAGSRHSDSRVQSIERRWPALGSFIGRAGIDEPQISSWSSSKLGRFTLEFLLEGDSETTRKQKTMKNQCNTDHTQTSEHGRKINHRIPSRRRFNRPFQTAIAIDGGPARDPRDSIIWTFAGFLSVRTMRRYPVINGAKTRALIP